MSRYQTILLFGAPGAGKGTIGKALGAIPGFYHLSCGDVFRNLDLNTELGRIFVEYSSRGELVPDDATVQFWKVSVDALVETHHYRPSHNFLVLDGIPRNLAQAEIMDSHIDVQRVLNLVCTDEDAMMDRLRRRALKENRFDDASAEVIRTRWEVFKQETAPVLAHYPPSIVENIDAMGSPARVMYDVLGRLLKMANP